MMLTPLFVEAACPVQETTLFFVNGVDTKRSSANDSIEIVRDEFAKTGISEECLTFDVAYNTNEIFFFDFLESGLQRAEEVEGRIEVFWEFFLRVKGAFGNSKSFYDKKITDLFNITNQAIQAGKYVPGDQLDEHLQAYRDVLANGQRVIMLGHSQGNLYVNSAWNQLSLLEQTDVRVIAVATPSDHVGSIFSSDPYTTLHKDSLAASLFSAVGALSSNTEMSQECDDELFGLIPASWLCHGFKEAYMLGDQSKEQILMDIIEALPDTSTTTVVQGKTYLGLDLSTYTSVQLYDNNYNLMTQTDSDSSGLYTFLAPHCIACSIEASVTILENNRLVIYSGSVNVDIILGQSYTIDIILFPEEMLIPI